MQNIPPQPAGSFGGPQPPAKKGLSKGCIIGIVAAVVLVLGAVLVIALGGVGFYWLARQAENMNRTAGGGARGGSSAPADGVDTPMPTSAQTAAVAGGQSADWRQQEMAWTVPQRWGEQEATSQSFHWRSPGTWDAASLIVNISPMSADFPTGASISAFFQQAVNRKANGEVDDVRWLNLGGVRGVMFRESAPEDEDSPQRLQWMGYRKYKGQTQLVNIMLASRGKDFARHEDALYGILYSTKL
jgi:hypothetical protein